VAVGAANPQIPTKAILIVVAAGFFISFVLIPAYFFIQAMTVLSAFRGVNGG
jgi:hypothetical protein